MFWIVYYNTIAFNILSNQQEIRKKVNGMSKEGLFDLLVLIIWGNPAYDAYVMYPTFTISFAVVWSILTLILAYYLYKKFYKSGVEDV